MLVDSFEDNYPGVCNGRSIWMIDCRKFDDPDCDKCLRTYVGRSPRIMTSIMGSKNYHELRSRLHNAVSRFFASKNIVIRICRSGRHRCVANAELWSNTLTRYGRHQHSVSLLHLSELDFWKAVKRFRNAGQKTRILQTDYDRVLAECSRLGSMPDSVTDCWKQPRSEDYSESFAGKGGADGSCRKFGQTCCAFARWRRSLLTSSEKRATSATTMPAESNLYRGILDERADRLVNFHESAGALADCLQTRDDTRRNRPESDRSSHLHVSQIAGRRARS